MAETIKSTYTKQVWILVVANSILFVLGLVSADTATSFAIVKWTLGTRATLGAVGSLVPGILNNLLSADMKARLVFWRWRNPLPGCEAFSKYINRDHRITPKVLTDRYRPLPSDARAQNALWYCIYKKHHQTSGVVDAHKNYLLYRDLSGIAAITFVFLGVAATLFFTSFWTVIGFWICILFEFLVLTHVARVAGQRFVCSVLAEESAV